MQKGLKVKTIFDEINTCISEYVMSTGFNPTRIYLGRNEMRALKKRAYENSCYTTQDSTAREGMERPEVLGLPAYEVNDDGPHIRVCA